MEESRNARGGNTKTQMSRVHCNARGGNTVTLGMGYTVMQKVEIQLNVIGDRVKSSGCWYYFLLLKLHVYLRSWKLYDHIDYTFRAILTVM